MFSKKNLHHAYFIEGDKHSVFAKILDFIKKDFGIKIEGNPDVSFHEHEMLGIEESREIKKKQSVKPFGEKKFFLIHAPAITVEAQNALLKTLEEPSPDNHFFIVSNSKTILLPTFISRVRIVSFDNEKEDDKKTVENFSKDEIISFINSDIKDRLKFVSKIIEEKDKQLANEFVEKLLIELKKRNYKDIKKIVNISMYINDRSSSLKLILESISLLNLR